MIFHRLASIIAHAGNPVAFVTIDGHRLEEQSRKALAELNLPAIRLLDMAHEVTSGDVICVGNDWSPKKLLSVLSQVRKRGVTIAGVVEGARFLRKGYYKNVDHLLCWGPSGLDINAKETTIVGSPVIEAAAQRGNTCPSNTVRILINYKKSNAKDDPDFAWGKTTIEAARAVDPNFMFSAHPSTRNASLDLKIHNEPFEIALSSASVVITKASTVIFEALASGVCVIYFPEPNEERVEFAMADGAFETANNAEELIAHVKAHAGNPVFPQENAQRFLNKHVSMENGLSANERTAACLISMLHNETSSGMTQ